MPTFYYIRTETEDEAKEQLPFAIGESGEWLAFGRDFVIDVIGPIEIEPPLIEDDRVVFDATFDDRFHINLILDDGCEHQIDPGICVHPENPKRVWA